MTAGSASIHSGSSAEDGGCGIEAHVMLGQRGIAANCANTTRTVPTRRPCPCPCPCPCVYYYFPYVSLFAPFSRPYHPSSPLFISLLSFFIYTHHVVHAMKSLLEPARLAGATKGRPSKTNSSWEVGLMHRLICVSYLIMIQAGMPSR